jgi:hypothetical protein
MPAPSDPYVDLVTGAVSGEITSGQSFSWYNSKTTGDCSVSGVGLWCSASSFGPISAGSYATTTAISNLTAGNYTFTCACCELDQPSVHVSAGHIPPGGGKPRR